ncbi:FAT-domain-containing protein [Macrolepiota fuliginosa MF-IS2]|uniref:FAT-domain-containing protein n=1 Tax=Macrolepiota fuliginosa MF-IS2 TaxID=1400762 RepID=A0A9P5XMF4_9AGAR|nr:FAT-domain-containing protein [Macrolepiota fuliginosa MF-IS2]
MALPSATPMEVAQHLSSTSDLEQRVARIADPNIDLRTKHTVASEIREILDTVRDTESARTYPYLVPALTELLRSGEPAFSKDTPEYAFRRVLLEILNRLPVSESLRPHAQTIFNCMLHVIRHDNEENGTTACKALVDIIRGYRILTEESLNEFVAIFLQIFQNMKGLVEEVLSEGSAILDPTIVFPSVRSFKVLGEMGMVIVIMSQVHRQLVSPAMQASIPYASEVLALESPAQHKARTDFEAMDGIWSGMSPTVKNAGAYSEFIHSQIKMLSYLAYNMRFSGEQPEGYAETLILSALRLLQDCPSNGIALRKELMVVFRHLMSTNHRRVLFDHLDKLFDEHVLLGTGIASKEMLRVAVYSSVTDLVHHLRNDLTSAQLNHIVNSYSCLVHNPALGNNLHTLFAKMMFGLTDAILAKETQQGAAKLLTIMFESCLERLEGLAIVHEEVSGLLERQKVDTPSGPDVFLIEKARPVGGATYAIDKPEDTISESRVIFRALLHGFRVCLASLKKCDAPIIDGTYVFRLFEGCIRCMVLLDPEPRPDPRGTNEYSDAVEWFGHALLEINLHVFQEVWTHKIDFFFDCARTRILLLNICQFLFAREQTSPTLLAIVLKYLVDRLPLLGEQDDMTAAATIRLYKMAFAAVSQYPVLNEPILASHLAKLLMDCFPLAAKATKPTHFFHLLRALFRAIGGGGGRFELLYKEVLPLLPEMLESLNRQLLASEGIARDMIVELCLTVPLRLTHLLPHLTYLMQPLALALRGSPELVSQGLRTLELCIDNLTPDFLDPTLSTVLRELMEALFNHLKPQPASHHAAHTTIRILGKLGGRNRRLLTKEPALSYHHHSESARMAISFAGSRERIDLGPVSTLAAQSLTKLSNPDREHAYHYLENCLSTIVYEGIKGRNAEDVFIRTLEGVYDAIHIPELSTEAKTYIRNLSRSVFELSIRKHQSRDAKGGPNRLLFCYLDALPHALAREQPEQAEAAQELIAKIIEDLVAMKNQPNVSQQEIIPILHHMANRFTALCLDEQWVRKSAGCSGIKLMTQTPDLAQKWISDREGELVRTLLHIFKDLPLDISRDIDDIIDILLEVLRTSNAHLDLNGEGAAAARNKLVNLMGIFFPEIQNSNPIVRQAAQKCIGYLVSLSGRPAVDLLMPHRDRMLTGIYTKPLRALPFSKQIGMIEAIRYCVSLDPPLVELNEELLRLLHETLALADADDAQLLGRGSVRQGTIEITKLRVACIRLLTASMPITDFFSRQAQTRQRVTGVYFKSLYSPSPEVKDVAHEGLRMVLTHQSRLPKELLQTGLRPILMNLADPKRLSVPGLEGLARLLELLTNYFKVEIGHKLLDHFRSVADPQMLQQSSRLPLADHEGISKLVKLANIFHLLPSTANIFLENLVNAVVQTEAQMHFSTRSPFSEPLAKYLDRYPVEGIDFFMRHLKLPQHLRTLRSILLGRYAPNLERELASRTPLLVNLCAQGADTSMLTQALLLFHDLAEISPSWISDYELAIDALVKVWRSSNVQTGAPDLVQRHSLILGVFMKALQQSPRIDLLFDIVAVFDRNLSMDVIHVSQFLYKHVALSEDTIFRRNVLLRFLTWFGDVSVPWNQKGSFLRYIITPTLLIHASRGSSNERLLDIDYINKLHRLIWQENVVFADADDMFKIELLHFTTILVQHYSDLLEDVKKDIIKCAWHHITNSDDIIVKQTAYLLAAQFFAAFPTPQKFILRAWTGLLRLSHSEGKPLVRQEALAVLAPVLPQADSSEPGHPQWAKTTRRLLAEEGLAQMIAIYHLIIKQPELFYPVRSLFVPHMANSLSKLGMSTSSTAEMRSLSIEVLQVIFDWEEQATQAAQDNKGEAIWLTPIGLRENMISYLVRLATFPHDQAAKATLVPRALTLLQSMVGPNGWTEVTVGLRYFSRTLEQNDLSAENALSLAIASAKVLQVITAEQSDTWFTTNATALQKLIRKGLLTDDHALQDALHPIFDHLIRLFPLPKEEEEQQTELSDFHSFVNNTIGDGLRNSNTPRSILLMLKSVVTVTPERVEAFSQPLMKLLSKLAKEHIQSPPTNGTEGNVRLIILLLEICQISVTYLADQRRWLLSTLVVLVEKSKSVQLCRYMLDLARTWAMHRQEAYPTMKEKASLIQKMTFYETRGEVLFHPYLELIYDIYTEPSLRRSDLTTRLEPAFLLGCRAKDALLRERFMDLLDVSVPRSLFGRLTYILGVQSWEVLADHNWIYLALHLILGAADLDAPVTTDRRQAHSDPLPAIQRPDARSVVRPLQRLLFLDPQTAHEMWCSVFPAAWSGLSRREQMDITNHMINLLSKEYHIKQAHLRPNVIQTLLTGIYGCSPPLMLPPHLVKYLAKTFGAWHVALEILGSSLEMVKDDEPNIREYVHDSLAEVYAELADEDMFYGLWRRRSLHQETNIALAFEQHGFWEQASAAYENAQTKARGGTIAFSEPEYCLWEDHWVLAAEKLQQWDILYDFAKSEGNQELMLESAWRIKDWADNKDTLEEQVKQLPEIPTPRRRVFEAFLALLKFPGALDKNTEFTKVLEDAMQLSLRKWVGLPTHLSSAHVPLLQHFQQFVELQEAVQIFGSLSQTNAQNLEKKSSELKMVLQAWRERLPNIQDDINLWSDLVAWRQNVFHAINNAYMPLINNQGNNNANTNTNTYGFRGYHETAWIINRFAHVARKHDLLDVCFTSLTKIYTLPNIEISEAFLKLREQARCHYQKPNDLQAGLDVINNTNLMFFSNSQKAEFYTLKGMFHARLTRNEEANHAFGQAVQLDMAQAKAWAEWGRFNDRVFKNAGAENTDLTNASSAVSCYLQAAGLYKNGKSRPLLTRILWLLSLDDSALTISKAFDTYKGDAAFWYWIVLTPQLCQSLNHREAKQARYLLLNLARHYPQALFYHLRTYREELQLMRKAAQARAISLNQPIMDTTRRPDEPAKDSNENTNGAATAQGQTPANSATTPNQNGQTSAEAAAAFPRQASELVDEVLQVLKTTFPLLILSLETMVDQIHQKFKPPQEEDIYRHICLLLQEAIQNYILRMNALEDDGSLAPHTQQTLSRLAPIIGGPVRKEFEEDFLVSKPNHYEYIRRLQQWRDKYERMLDSRPRIQPLALVSHYLTEFQYNKIDEIEVPGQYTEDKDTNQNFVKIQKFASKFELGRSNGTCWKRFTLHGNDNTKTSFMVQIPCHRQCRREDKVMQVLRTFNGVLQRKKETRKRNLSFHLPAAISCSPTLRLFQTDSSYITLGDIYELHCEDTGISREEPILFAGEKVKKTLREFRQNSTRQLTKTEYITLKSDIYDEVAVKMVPDTVLTNYMIRTMDGPSELWRMRRQFASQLSASCFMTFVFCLSSRHPSRFQICRSTGQVAMTELLPGISSGLPVFATSDVVPFRLTSNMQTFLGPIFTEGILTSGIMAIARSLTEPEYTLEQQLCLFGRDEVISWMTMQRRPWMVGDAAFRQGVAANIDGVVKRAEVMACKTERENQLQNNGATATVPVVQTITNLISTATNPVQLAKMGELYLPWF